MNIRKFKQPKIQNKNEYIVIITYFDIDGVIYDKDYILCENYTDATRFIYWKYHELKEKIFREYISNNEKHDDHKYIQDDFEFMLNKEHEFAYIYNCYIDEYIYNIDIVSVTNTSKYRMYGYDSSVNTNDIQN